MKKKRNQDKWFNPSVTTNWKKTDSQETRRRNTLKAHKGNYLATARSLMALANVTQDSETKRKARADSLHFYALNKRKKAKCK